jgi:hypothetical protein
LLALEKLGGQAAVEVPREPDGSFEPQTANKRHRRLTGIP